MIEKWQQTVALLLSEVNFNIELVFPKNVALTTTSLELDAIENNWKQSIFNTVNKAVNKNEINTIVLLIAKDGIYDIYRDEFLDNRFIDYFWKNIKDADGVRICVLNKFRKQQAFIIVRK